MKKFSKYLTEILTEMCSKVGAAIGDIDWDDDQWYISREWLEEDQKDFEKWLVNYWHNNAKARRSMTTCHKHKGRLRIAAKEFTFNYGWKLKD